MLNSFKRFCEVYLVGESTPQRQTIFSQLKEDLTPPYSKTKLYDIAKNMVNLYFTQRLNYKSMREPHYQMTPFIAEFFCTLTNLGFFAVAYHYQDYATLMAGLFSALSHAFPSQRFHDLDLIGVYLIGAKVFYNSELLYNRPDVLAWGAIAMSCNLFDTYFHRQYPHQFALGTPIHLAWHTMAAYFLYQLNQAQVQASPTLNVLDMDSPLLRFSSANQPVEYDTSFFIKKTM